MGHGSGGEVFERRRQPQFELLSTSYLNRRCRQANDQVTRTVAEGWEMEAGVNGVGGDKPLGVLEVQSWVCCSR